MMVSLPASWIRKRGLKKGDEVTLLEHQGDIVVSTKNAEVKRKEITIKNAEDYMNRLIDTPYLQGYDEILVSFKDPQVIRKILNRTEMLLGFEVVEQTGTTCTIRNVAQGAEEEFDTILRRIFLLVKTAAQDSLRALETKDKEMLNSIAQLDKLCHKYYLFSYRLLTKFGHKKREEIPGLYLTIYSLEQVSDHLAYLCEHFADNKRQNSIKAYKSVVETITAFEKHFFSCTQESAKQLRKQLKKTLKKVFEEKPSLVQTKLAHITEIYYQLAPFIV